MRHSQTSRNIAKAFFAFATIATIQACADNSVAPSTPAAPAFSGPAAYNTLQGVVIFTVDNSTGGTFRLGQHVISFQAGAICSLTSSYGATEWNKPCTAARGSVTITATLMRDNENHPYVDFQPAMRFAPDKDVMLFLRNGLSSRATLLNVQYCNNLGYCVNESLNDPSVAPFRVGKTSYIGRRLKHFSGYLVQAGDNCEGTLTQEADGSWMCYTDDGMTRRSGYMVASGLQDGDNQGANKGGKKDSDNQ
jgi:hypothetical protein